MLISITIHSLVIENIIFYGSIFFRCKDCIAFGWQDDIDINVNHGKWYERKLKELFQHRGHAAKPEDKGATVCTENQF